jgi:hypothetical protein
MPTKGIKEINRSFTALANRIKGPMTEQTLTAILIEGGAAAAAITPRDTSFLVNSMYRKIVPLTGGMLGKIGYAADYAGYVNAASGKLKGKPRSSVASFETASGKTAFASSQGNFWDPHAEPDFLRKGFQRDALPVIKRLIKEGYRL